MRVVLADVCGVRRSADTVCDQFDIQTKLSARLFRQGFTKVNEWARYEYVKDIGLDLARP